MNHDKMSNISAKRGFLWPSFEIYSGVSGFTDYGPLGASLKNNIMQKWRKQYVSGEGFYEIEGPTVTDAHLSSIVEYELIPMLKEYWFDEPLRVKEWSDILRGAIR